MMGLDEGRYNLHTRHKNYPKIQDGGQAHFGSTSRVRDRYREVTGLYVEDYWTCMKNRKLT